MKPVLRSLAIPCISLVAIVSALACTQAQPEPGDPSEPEVGPAADAAQLFSLELLPRFELELDADAWAALEAEPKEYVRGRFTYEGETFDPVGIRLKGNHSFRPLDEKPAFKIKFNKYERGQRFLGLEGLTLNNMVVDRSMLREWISYRVFRALGVPAPRVGFAEIELNGENYGLYLDIEPYDDEFLARVYDDPSGNLYESDKSADLDTDIWNWDQDEGEDETRADLQALADLALADNDAVFYGDTARIDMPRFLAFMAAETIVGHFDGHMGGHNFFIYHEPTLDLWSYQPWSLDQALARHVGAFDHEGFLADKCLHDGACLVDYLEASQEAAQAFAALDFEAEVAEVIELTDAAMRRDPRKPYSNESVESGRANSLDFILGRGEELAPQLDCLVDGAEPDADDDGYGPCFQDCDESDAAINPDAEELCDGIDNDCTGYADDVPSCECPSIESGGRTFYLCHNHINWLAARSFCDAQGHTLAHFDTEEQQAEVWAAASEITGGRWAIGLNDRGVEAEFVWADGSAPSFTTWANGEPSQQLEWFDCVFLSGGGWFERNCIEDASFICSDDGS